MGERQVQTVDTTMNDETRAAKKREYQREYKRRPEVAARYKEASKRRYTDPEARKKILDYQRKYNALPEVKARMKEWNKEYYSRPGVKERLNAQHRTPERRERQALLEHIRALRSKPFRTPTEEERLGCYERAFELNFIEKKFEVGKPAIPLCAINAGKEESEETKEVLSTMDYKDFWKNPQSTRRIYHPQREIERLLKAKPMKVEDFAKTLGYANERTLYVKLSSLLKAGVIEIRFDEDSVQWVGLKHGDKT